MEPIRDGDVDISGAARLLADPARARMLTVLTDGRAQPAGELARAAGVTAATASEHLGKLAEQGWLAVERVGRHRYYRISLPEVVQVIEAMAVISPIEPVKSLRGSRTHRDLRLARTCYDHLAGAVGVALFDGLCDASLLDIVDGHWTAAERAHPLLDELAIAPTDLHRFGRRPPARTCLDWSERRYHLAGGLGALLLTRMLDAGWCAHAATPRAITVTTSGWAALHRTLGIDRETVTTGRPEAESA
ncbi:ArsR family transcriptional regulator [Nocardia yunnanensis]|uniref:ArsR family transcriptional regulator n=1 Tax=Nocardia yunnanensis TaxID=2382165 RepID=A0A386Z911_9NOCA|nr:winged helix-turn-helix domain-containing protein [Nocardia yunnanensis]AYF74292.1 ArsR family transcriptional regulator [Nocardia yunnanensis]